MSYAWTIYSYLQLFIIIFTCVDRIWQVAFHCLYPIYWAVRKEDLKVPFFERGSRPYWIQYYVFQLHESIDHKNLNTPFHTLYFS